MTRVREDQSTEARVHALVIGVGGYDHLPGWPQGDARKPMKGHSKYVIDQISSASASALEFARFLTEDVSSGDWETPLGSVDLLLSPSPEQDSPMLFGAQEVEPATLDNILSAYDRWRTSCDANTGNVLLFYYAGHGFQKDCHVVLAQDFGSARSKWSRSIDLDASIAAIGPCRAGVQLFFIDSCRSSAGIKDDANVNAVVLDSYEYDKPDGYKSKLVLRAARRGRFTNGQANAPSSFCRALTEALKGKAATESDGEWIVETAGLQGKVDRIIKAIDDQAEGIEGNAVGESAVLLRREDPPDVLLTVTGDPQPSWERAKVCCAGPKSFRRQVPSAGPWTLEVRGGVYQLTGTASRDDDLPDVVAEPVTFLADPPTEERTLRFPS